MDAGAYREFADEVDRHWWFIGRKAIFRHVVRRFVGAAAAPRRIFDLGCGMGGMLEDLSEHGEVFGGDMAQDALVHCKEQGYPRVMKCVGGQLPFPDASLDLITAFDCIEHIPDDVEALRECHRALKPGGRIVISVPAYQWLYSHQDHLVAHQRRYHAGMLARRLESVGFKVRRLSYINFFLFPVILPVVLLIKLKERLNPPGPDSYSSNVSIKIPTWLNDLLAGIFSFERHLVANVNVPVGHSLLAVASKE